MGVLSWKSSNHTAQFNVGSIIIINSNFTIGQVIDAFKPLFIDLHTLYIIMNPMFNALSHHIIAISLFHLKLICSPSFLSYPVRLPFKPARSLYAVPVINIQLRIQFSYIVIIILVQCTIVVSFVLNDKIRHRSILHS